MDAVGMLATDTDTDTDSDVTVSDVWDCLAHDGGSKSWVTDGPRRRGTPPGR
ncbi:hypothetical protein AB0N09_42540 [Streptomyces erythrochromogenes]|uniref:hypothetical protein n=1 Tax=Streptomyces erythrochromogenes TaxID=285574 RepID=UPI0034341929